VNSPPDVGTLGTILGVWAHPDDEAFLSAGIMAMAADAGARVVCVTATRGEAGSREPGLSPTAVGRLREAELQASLELLGVAEHHWLDYLDGSCADVDPQRAAARLRDIVEDVSPDTVLTFGPDGFTDHADHKAVSGWVTTAVVQSTKRRRPKVHHAVQTAPWARTYRSRLAALDVYPAGCPPLRAEHDLSIDVTLTPDIAARKVKALRAQASQIDRLIDAVGEDFFGDAFRTERFAYAPTRRRRPG
jgi:LmbE family N-acetylglucosaminyl deacetylase